jgi:hypothetical protein
MKIKPRDSSKLPFVGTMSLQCFFHFQKVDFNLNPNFNIFVNFLFLFVSLFAAGGAMECAFQRFGCKTKLSNEDHSLAHSRDSVSQHLTLVVQAFDQEAERNKLLAAKCDLLHKWIKDHDEKLKGGMLVVDIIGIIVTLVFSSRR